MRPLQPISLTTVTTSAWIPLDIYTNSPNVTIDLSLTGGTATFQVDFTDDDPFNPAITPVVAGQAVASASANSVTHLTYVPRAIRLNVTVVSGATVTMKVTQQGIGGV